LFNAASVPAGLLRDHALKAGVWGLLRVARGKVVFRDAQGAETRLRAGDA